MAKKKFFIFFFSIFPAKSCWIFKRLLCLIALSPALAFYTISLWNIYFRFMYKARIKQYRRQPQTAFFILLSFSIHRPQKNLGSPTPAVTFNWRWTQNTNCIRGNVSPGSCSAYGQTRGIRNLWSHYWCKWHNGIMLMTRHWITLVYLFNWLSDKPSYGPYLRWEAYWMISVLLNVISAWAFHGGVCMLSWCLLGLGPAGRLPSSCPKTRLGEGNWFSPVWGWVWMTVVMCQLGDDRGHTSGFRPCQGK